MGGQPNTGTQTTGTIPSQAAQSLMPYAQQFAQSYGNQGGTTLPGWSPIAQFTGPQQTGQQMALNAGQGAQQTAANNASGAQSFLTTGAALDPNTNPGLASSIRFAQLPIQQQLQESTLPGLRSNATAVGDLGSSREGIAEGIATRGAEQAQGNIAASMTNQNYQNALDQMTKAMGLTPTVQTAQITPATTTSGVGDVQQALNQANLGYNYQAALFPQENLLSTAQALAGISAGLPGGTTSSTAQATNNMNPAQIALGLGSLGAGLFGSGGALSGLGSLFSGAGSSLGSLFGAGAGAGGTGAAALGGASGGDLAALLPFLAMV